MASRFRVESGSVYEFDADLNCYVFCGKLNGRTLEEFISEYEQDCD